MLLCNGDFFPFVPSPLHSSTEDKGNHTKAFHLNIMYNRE